MTEASRLAAFLLALQTSAGARKRFREDPEAEMKGFGLSTKTIGAVQSGDRDRLWQIVTRIPTTQVGHVVVGGRSRRRRRA
jgi:hypothetical protein